MAEQTLQLSKIPGFNYSINTNGDIWSHARNKWLTPGVSHNGYFQVRLYKDHKYYDYRVHRLVMLVFVGESDLPVNHINCNKKDNRLENLEYVTHKENMIHAGQNGRLNYNKGKNNPAYKHGRYMK